MSTPTANLEPTTPRFDEVPLLQTVLCKHKGTTWSEVFEITKFAYSKNGKCVYLRSMFGAPGNQVTNYFWRDVADLNDKYVVFDVMNPK